MTSHPLEKVILKLIQQGLSKFGVHFKIFKMVN
jgi:hypothetical protein